MPDVPVSEVAVLAQWTFRRGADRLHLRREHHGATDFRLSVARGAEEPRYRFDSLDRLVKFQSDMETFLVRTGWVLEAFSPERRSGRDRRRMPRIDAERRRWWTDAWPE